MMAGLLLYTAISFFVLVVRIGLVFIQICRNRKIRNLQSNDDYSYKRTKPVKTIVVFGSGGHTTEMIRLLSPNNLSSKWFSPLIHIFASTDTTSELRIQATSSAREADIILKIPRSREVGQSYVTSIFTTIHALIYSFYIVVFQTRPDLILCNGPGTCLPIAASAFIGRVLGLCEGQVIFVESFCRVEREVLVHIRGPILCTLGRIARKVSKK